MRFNGLFKHIPTKEFKSDRNLHYGAVTVAIGLNLFIPGKATSLKQHEDPYTSSESATPRRLCDSGALLDRARKELPRRTTWHLAMGRARQEVLHPFLNVFNEYRSEYSIDSNVCGKSIVVDEVCGSRVLVK